MNGREGGAAADEKAAGPAIHPESEPGQGSAPARAKVATKTVRLPSGEVAELTQGWNEFPDLRVYLRRDGEAVPYKRDERPNVMMDGNPAGNLGSPRQVSPIVEGHEVTIVHGAWSARRVDPLAAELIETAVGSVSWLDDPSYRPAVTSWARAEARCQLLAEYLDKHGILEPATGEPRPALAAAERMERLALQQRQRLGLDPASRSQLEATLTSARQGQAALDDAIRRGQESLRARQDAHVANQDPQAPPPDTSQGAAETGAHGETGARP